MGQRCSKKIPRKTYYNFFWFANPRRLHGGEVQSIDLHTPLYKYVSFFDRIDHDEYIDAYVERIQEYDPDYEKPKPKKLFGII